MSATTDYLPDVADRRKMLKSALANAKAQSYAAQIELACTEVQTAGNKAQAVADLKNTISNAKVSIDKLNELLAELPEDSQEEE